MTGPSDHRVPSSTGYGNDRPRTGRKEEVHPGLRQDLLSVPLTPVEAKEAKTYEKARSCSPGDLTHGSPTRLPGSPCCASRPSEEDVHQVTPS